MISLHNTHEVPFLKARGLDTMVVEGQAWSTYMWYVAVTAAGRSRVRQARRCFILRILLLGRVYYGKAICDCLPLLERMKRPHHPRMHRMHASHRHVFDGVGVLVF